MINEVSRRYARALYDLAQSHKTTDKVFGELRAFAEASKSNAEIREFIESPIVSPDQKIKALEGGLKTKISEELMSTMKVMAEKNRLPLLPEVAQAFEAINDEAHGVTRGVVRSATPISNEERKRIEETVNKVTKKKVILTYEEDANLLGGMVAQVGGWTFDDSLKSHLAKLSEELNRRPN